MAQDVNKFTSGVSNHLVANGIPKEQADKYCREYRQIILDAVAFDVQPEDAGDVILKKVQ